LLTTIMIAPLTWLHHYVFAMPAVICCFALLPALEKSTYKILITIGVLISVAILSFPSIVNVIFPAFATLRIANKTISLGANLVTSAQLVASLVFWGLFSLIVFDRKRL